MNAAAKIDADREYLGEGPAVSSIGKLCGECGGRIPPGEPFTLHHWTGDAEVAVCALCEELRRVVCAPMGKVRSVFAKLAKATGPFLPGILLGRFSPAGKEEMTAVLAQAWGIEPGQVKYRLLVKPNMTRAEISRAIIHAVLADVGREDDGRLRAELRAAYPFGERRQRPWRIWRREIRRILGPAPSQATGIERQNKEVAA